MAKSTRSLRPQWAEMSQEEFQSAFQALRDLRDLAEFWEIPPSQIGYYAYAVDKRSVYTTFGVPRRNGHERQIEAPSRTLKYIQRIMHESLAQIYRPHNAVHGFLQARSIVTNAMNHVGQRYVLNIDLVDFSQV